MKIKSFLALVLTASFLVSPFHAYADLIPGDPVPDTFENQQELILELNVDGVPLVDMATSSLPVGTPFEVAYEITLSTKSHQDETAEVREEILLSAIEDSFTYLELWRGVPFSAGATLVTSQELGLGSSGTVNMSASEGGSHFFVLYIGGEVRDRAAYCEKYDVLPEDCADPEYWLEYPPEVIRPYFTYPLDSDESGNLEYVPWWGGVRFTVGGPAELGASNVLFIPGFTASRLYMTDTDGDEEPLWEPLGSEDIRRLAMNPDGTSKHVIYTRDIVDTIKGLPFAPTVHKKFMEYLDTLEADGTINEWKGYPYDWRYDVFDVVDDGALKEDGTREYLIDELDLLAASSKSGKVSIVAHSNGGLVAKALMVRLAEQGKTDLVDTIVLIGSPQAGTPKGLTTLLHGRDKLLNFIIPADVLRTSLATLPGAYTLAPSALYYERESEKVGEFVDGAKTSGFIDAFGDAIDGIAEARGFALNVPETRPVPGADESGSPLPLSSALIAQMEETHAVLDAWTAPDGVAVYEIAGWGQPTARGAIYSTIKRPCFLISLFCTEEVIEYEPRVSHDGDNTVMSASAVLSAVGTYVNLEKLSEQFRDDRKHLDLTESQYIQQYLSNLLIGPTQYEETAISTSKPNSSAGNTIVGVHSPAIIQATDDEGNVTGVFALPDSSSDLMYVREEIPGSSVELGGEGKYLVLPDEGEYEVTVTGTGSGTFSLTFADEDGNVFKEISDLPIATSTEATLTLDGTTVGQLALDVDGDGKSDAKVSDKLTRKDAVKICKKEIGLVRTLFVRIYLGLLVRNIELQRRNAERFDRFVGELKTYVQKHLESIPSERAMAIATCIHALENSKK